MRLSDFRFLVPSWLFFDDFGAGCRVLVRSGGSSDSSLEAWTPLFAPQSRKLLELIHAPDSNFRLYVQSQMERLLEESQGYVEKPEYFLRSELYIQCVALLRSVIALRSEHSCFQFKIQARLEGGDSLFQDAFSSPLHES